MSSKAGRSPEKTVRALRAHEFLVYDLLLVQAQEQLVAERERIL